MNTLNVFLQKRLAFLTPLSVCIGLLFANELYLFVHTVPWVFAFITFASSLGIQVSRMKLILLRPTPIFVALLIIQCIMPCIAYSIGHLTFSTDPYTITGLIIAFIIPTGVVSMMWVSIYGGNSSLSILIVVINTLLAPLLIPLSLFLFVGANVDIRITEVMTSLIWMIVIPSLLGMFVQYLSYRRAKAIQITVAPISKIALCIVIAINSAVAAPVITLDIELLMIAFVVLFVASFGYLLGIAVAKFCKYENDVMISFMFHSGMRNISVGATIAILYFPAKVSVPVVIGTLFQQTLAAIFGRMLPLFLHKRGQQNKKIVKHSMD
ncbi:bile acid:sodium symporter family protein [Alkalihalobacterium bogoriense]|uniref:bile acid:sodium symporter family protein n=1 Tax=Alkalihalobacterium bogoriense TaxID=246272 RepID=UPI0004791F03|nr:bile acid:sodium symporter family protein [Alkalihalobacterium bogoriense]